MEGCPRLSSLLHKRRKAGALGYRLLELQVFMQGSWSTCQYAAGLWRGFLSSTP